uniref:2-oxoglutarate dehydrogenase E1 component N-terminal domain-containing protein n=1 Tax=Parascaris univalens TaxID=6257 RepID=A0A915A3P6_PARUN
MLGAPFRCHRNAAQVRCIFNRTWFTQVSCAFEAFLDFFFRLRRNTVSFNYTFAMIARNLFAASHQIFARRFCHLCVICEGNFAVIEHRGHKR